MEELFQRIPALEHDIERTITAHTDSVDDDSAEEIAIQATVSVVARAFAKMLMRVHGTTSVEEVVTAIRTGPWHRSAEAALATLGEPDD